MNNDNRLVYVQFCVGLFARPHLTAKTHPGTKSAKNMLKVYLARIHNCNNFYGLNDFTSQMSDEFKLEKKACTLIFVETK